MRIGLRECILLAVLLALPLSSYWLVFRPQNSEIAQARREIEHKRLMLEKLQQTTARNADLQRANEEIRQSIDAIEAGLEPPAIESDKPVKAAMYMEQPLKMKINGDFDGFYRFLIALEQLPRITRIPSMEITRANDVDGHMKAEFTLSIYFQQDEGSR